MATIIIKNSSRPNGKPSDLNYGELGLNYKDKEIYFKDGNGNIVGLLDDVKSHLALIDDELNGINTAIGSGNLIV